MTWSEIPNNRFPFIHSEEELSKKNGGIQFIKDEEGHRTPKSLTDEEVSEIKKKKERGFGAIIIGIGCSYAEEVFRLLNSNKMRDIHWPVVVVGNDDFSGNFFPKSMDEIVKNLEMPPLVIKSIAIEELAAIVVPKVEPAYKKIKKNYPIVKSQKAKGKMRKWYNQKNK